MNTKTLFFSCAAVGVLAFLLAWEIPATPSQRKKAPSKAMIERGSQLVHLGGCNDCHSPKVFTKMGPMMVPVPDTSRLLSGHPSEDKLPEVPQGVIAPDKWGALTTNDLTAWVGPWGTSFTRNLTPDVATGLGSWTEEMFIKTIRTGKHMGEGRDILPPMPWPEYKNLPDSDLKTIWAYLRSIKPIENEVPDPISPAGEKIPTLPPTKK